MPYPPPHDATLSELAHETWAGPTELEFLPTKESELMNINGAEGIRTVLCLSQDLVSKITRALCIGRGHRAGVARAQRNERKLIMRLVDKRATIEMLQFRRELLQKKVEAGERLTEQRVQGFEELLKRIGRCRHDEKTIEEDLKDLETHKRENLEAWKTAWLSVDKILDKVWTDADLIHDNDSDSDSDSEDEDDDDTGPDDDDAPLKNRGNAPSERGGHPPTEGHFDHSDKDERHLDRSGQRTRPSGRPLSQTRPHAQLRQSDRPGGIGDLSPRALQERHRAWESLCQEQEKRVAEQDKAVEAARNTWSEYIDNFEDDLAKYKSQLDMSDRSEHTVRDEFRCERWTPKVLELGQILNERTKTRNEVAGDAARKAGLVADVSEPTEQLIDKDNVATIHAFKGARIWVDRWLENVASAPTINAMEGVEWPRDKDEYDDINEPASTIEAEDSASHRATRELEARLEAEEGKAFHEKDNDTEIRQARPYYLLAKLFGGILEQQNAPVQGPIRGPEQNDTTGDKERPNQLARSSSAEPAESSVRKRRHDGDALSSTSKTQKRTHGDDAASQLRETTASHLIPSASRISASQRRSRNQGERGGRRRQLPWEMNHPAVTSSSQKDMTDIAKPPPLPRKQPRPSARDFFAEYVRKQNKGVESWDSRLEGEHKR